MRLYVQQRLDLADKTALDAEITATTDKENFPIGSLFVCANGSLYIVVTNDGTTVTTIAVGAQTT